MNQNIQPIYDMSGRRVRLGPLVAKGGEGAVFETIEHPEQMIKIYHPADATTQRERETKILDMLKLETLRAYSRLAWPQAALVDSTGRVVGFQMRKIHGVTLVPLSALALMRVRLPKWTTAHVVRVAHDAASLFLALERHSVIVGDVSLSNLLADPVTAETSAIDCDSYQLTFGDRVYGCRVFTPDFQPPERFTDPNGNRYLTPFYFRFSAALLFFTILTCGGHPYSIKNGLTPQENIRAGRHFLGGRGVATGATTDVIWRRYCSLPPRVMWLFKRCFIGGHSADINARPDFEEWRSAFAAYYAALLPS